MTLLSACGGDLREDSLQENEALAFALEEDRELLAELRSLDWPVGPSGSLVRFFVRPSLTAAREDASWDDPVVKRVKDFGSDIERIVAGVQFISEGEGRGSYAVGHGDLRVALLSAMTDHAAEWGGENAVNQRVIDDSATYMEFESELILPGFHFESRRSEESSFSAQSSKDRITHRYRVRIGGEVFSCKRELVQIVTPESSETSGDLRPRLEMGSMGFAEMLQNFVSHEGPHGERFSVVFVSSEGGDEVEVYLHYPFLQ